MTIFCLFLALSAQFCALPREKLTIPQSSYEEAVKRAKLAELLNESVRGFANHTIDQNREREIKKLAREIAKGK